jgi:hypothetical protein
MITLQNLVNLLDFISQVWAGIAVILAALTLGFAMLPLSSRDGLHIEVGIK